MQKLVGNLYDTGVCSQEFNFKQADIRLKAVYSRYLARVIADVDSNALEHLAALCHFGDRLVRMPDVSLIMLHEEGVLDIFAPHVFGSPGQYFFEREECAIPDPRIETIYFARAGELTRPKLALGADLPDMIVAADGIVLAEAKSELTPKAFKEKMRQIVSMLNDRDADLDELMDLHAAY
jgi:hypothetical protein